MVPWNKTQVGNKFIRENIMKTKTKSYLTIAFALSLVTLLSCNHEKPLEPIANFTISGDNNTVYAGESFYMYLDQAQGDFLTLFSGINAGKKYNPDDPTVVGNNIDPSLDSFEVTLYKSLGVYRMTLVASSSGDWGDVYVQDTFGIDNLYNFTD